MAKLSSLLIDLQVQTAGLKKGLDDASARLKNFEANTKGILGAVKGASQALSLSLAKDAVGALTSFVMKGSQAADAMGKMAQAVGVPVAELSRLSFAASQSGVGTEQLGAAFKKLNGNLAEAGAGSRAQVALFSALGVAVKDASGKARGADAVLKDLADRFAQMEDGPAKAKLAVELFGKEGARLLPLLNEGAEGIAKMEAEADKLGITLDEKAVAAATRFNDNLSSLGKAVDGIGMKVAGNLAPALEQLTGQLLKSEEGADSLKDSVTALTVIFKGLLSVGAIIAAAFEVVGKTLGRIASIVVDVLAGRFRGAMDQVSSYTFDMVGDVATAANGAKEKIETIWTATEKGSEQAAKKATLSADTIFKKFEEAKKPVKDLTKEFEKMGKSVGDAIQKLIDIEDLKIQLSFEASRSSAKLDRQQGSRRASFANIGASPADIFAQATAGFAGFNAALNEAAAQTRRATDLVNEAKVLEKQGSHELARAKLLEADAAEHAADRAYFAADAFEGFAVDAQQALDAMWAQVGSTVMAGVNQLSSMLGSVGGIIQAGIQGGQSGGIWGALIAIILELLSKFEGWGAVLDKAEAAFGKLIDDVGPGLQALVDAFMNLMDAVQPLANLIHAILNPILKIVAVLFQGIADTIGLLITILEPIFTIIGQALEGFASTLKDMFGSFKPIISVLKPIFQLFGALAKVLSPIAPIFFIIGVILKGLSLIILGVMWAIGKAINAIAQIFDPNSEPVDTDAMEDQMAEVVASFETSFEETREAIEGGSKKVAKAFDEAEKRIAKGQTGYVEKDEGTKGKAGLRAEGTGTVVVLPPKPTDYGPDTLGTSVAKTPGAFFAMSMEDFASGLGYGLAGKALEEAYQKYLESIPGYVKPLENLGEKVEEAADKFEKLNESMTNVPEGFKANLRRFQAAAEQDIPSAGGTPPIQIFNEGGITTTIEKVIDMVEQGLQRRGFQRHGLPVPT